MSSPRTRLRKQQESERRASQGSPDAYAENYNIEYKTAGGKDISKDKAGFLLRLWRRMVPVSVPLAEPGKTIALGRFHVRPRRLSFYRNNY